MSLANHLIETYEDRKLMHPPQNVQRSAAANHIMQQQNSRAGPSTHHGANMAHGQQAQGGGQQMGEGDGNWSNHGMPWWMAMPPYLRAPQQTLTPWSEEKVAQMQVRLARKLGPEYVTQRPGPGGGPKLSYIEGWKVINLANEVFGFSGWSSSIVSLVTDFIDVNEQGRCSISVSAQVRITLRDGAYHEDIGSGQAENVRGKASALDKAKKEAVTDATKRALRNFGNVLGNCLYDKSFTANVAKMKVPPPKWNPDELERRPEFTPAGGIKPPMAAPVAAPAPAPAPIAPPQPVQRDIPRAGTPLRSMNDSAVDQSVNITMDENFDAEFLDDSFFDVDADGEISAMIDAPQQKQSVSAPAASRPAQPQPPKQSAQPAYQHRHRPEPTITSGPSRSSTSAASHYAPSTSGPSRAQSEMQPPAVPEEVPARSSGTSSTTVESGPARPRTSGGVVPPERPPSNNAGQSARAQAIMAAARGETSTTTSTTSTTTTSHTSNTNAGPSTSVNHSHAKTSHTTPYQSRAHPPPIRSESPRIPAGGVDGVAARAASARNLRMSAARLDLDTGIGIDQTSTAGGIPLGGFSSARGMKRVVSGGSGNERPGEDRAPLSPSKQNRYHQPYQPVQRSGERRALGEIAIPDPDWDDRAKRQRAM